MFNLALLVFAFLAPRARATTPVGPPDYVWDKVARNCTYFQFPVTNSRGSWSCVDFSPAVLDVVGANACAPSTGTYSVACNNPYATTLNYSAAVSGVVSG